MCDFKSGLEFFGDNAPDSILLLDTETTGLRGAEYDRDPGFVALKDDGRNRLDRLNWNNYGDLVLDIGICEVSLTKGTVNDVYSSIVGYDTSIWNEQMRKSWIFENSDLRIEDVDSAPPLSTVVSDVRKIVKDKWVTSYNVQYDLDKFLYRFPWMLKNTFREVRDPMFSAKDICKLKNIDYRIAEYRYPKLDYAYEKILEGQDPAGIHGTQNHRALSDAQMASYLLLKMYNEKKYDPLDFSGRHSSFS